MTTAQVKLVQIAKRQLQLDDWAYREIIRRIGRVESCTKLSAAGLERVLAFFESRGFRHVGKSDTHWRDRVSQRGGTLASPEQDWEIHRLHAIEPRYELAALCRRFSHNRTEQVSELEPREAWELIEMLKVVIERDTSGTTSATAQLFSE